MNQIKTRINTGTICPKCQGEKEYRSLQCFDCHLAEKCPPVRNCKECNLPYKTDETNRRTCQPCLNKTQQDRRDAETPEERKVRNFKRKVFRDNNPDKTKKVNMIRRFKKLNSATKEEINAIINLLETQKTCTICGTHTDTCGTLHIDHDHTTGQFRGLLCGTCNTGIGMLKDSPTVLAAAIEYLIKSRN